MKNKKGFTLIEMLSVVVILGLLMAIAVPMVSKIVMSSRKKTLVETMRSYMSALTVDVNDDIYYFSGKNTVYAVPIECIDVDKGGTDPFGVWMPATSSQWAYVLVQFDSNNKEYIYGFTFKDNQGLGLYPVSQKYLNKDGSQIVSKIEVTPPKSGDIKSIVTLDRWKGFIVDETTDLVVLQAMPKGEEGNGETTCTLMQDVEVDPIPTPEPEEPENPTGPECTLEVVGTLGENGWYKGSSPVVQFKDVSSIVTSSTIKEYGIGTSSTNYDFNSNTSYLVGSGITTVYGYVKDENGNVGTCSKEVKYDNKVTTSEVTYGYQVYPKEDIASVSGSIITLNSYMEEYGEVLGVNIYLKSNSGGMNVTISSGSTTLSTRTISAGVKEMTFSFSGTYNSLKIDMGSSSNISLIERVELITDHTTGFYTNKDVYAYASSSDGVYYSFDGGSWQTDNKMKYTSNVTGNVKTKDSAGNESTATTISIGNIDKDTPLCESNTGSTTWAQSKTVKEHCGDLFSGCRSEYVSVTYPTASVKNIKNGIITIYDKAGNSTDCTVNIYVDSTAPVCTMSMTNSNGVVNSGAISGLDVTFKGTGTDNETDASGINSVTWTVSGNGTTYPNLSSTSGKNNGTYSAYAVCTDEAGNTSTSATKTVKISKNVLITFDKNGGSGSMSSINCDVDLGCTLSTNKFTRTNHIFLGWATSSSGSVVYNDGSNIKVSSDTTLYAKWQYVEQTYTLTYHNEGGSGCTSKAGVEGETWGTLCVPDYDGYTFAGWYTSENGYGTRITASSIVSDDLDVYADWEAEEYDITYVLNGGTNHSDNPDSYTYGYGATFEDPTRTGYAFDGWYTDSSFTGTRIYGISDTSSGDRTVYAEWSPITYTIEFDGNGATSGSTSSVICTYDQDCTLTFNGFNKTNYYFKGWSKTASGAVNYIQNANVWNLSSTQDDVITLYAVWEEETYKLTYDSQGGTTCDPYYKNVKYGSVWGELCVPAKSGYSFAGWYTETNGRGYEVTADSTVLNSLTVYAKWAVPEEYNITYYLNGGTNHSSNPASYIYGVGVSSFYSPTKSGYKFVGWYQDSTLTTPITNISTTRSGDVTLYAKWSGAPTLTCDPEPYPWSNITGKADVSASDEENDFLKFEWKRYETGAVYEEETQISFVLEHDFRTIGIYGYDEAGNSSQIWCYLKYDNMPDYTPLVLEAMTGSGNHNIASTSFDCKNNVQEIFDDRICTMYIYREDTTRNAVYDKLSFSHITPPGGYESGYSPNYLLQMNYYYMDGTTCVDKRYWDGSNYSSPTCSVKNVDYREIFYVDEAGNESGILTVYSVWMN